MSDARSTTVLDSYIGVQLRAARMGAHLSQQRLAEHLGLTFQQVQKYEKGMNRIAASRLVRIAEVLEKPLAYFVYPRPINANRAKLIERVAKKRATAKPAKKRPAPRKSSRKHEARAH